MSKFPFKIIDLTHTLSSEVPTWDGTCGFKHRTEHDYDSPSVCKFRVQSINMEEGSGTHIDAPAHFVPGGVTIDQLSLEDLIVPCVMIDVSNKAGTERDDILEFEKKHGEIAKGSFVIIYTGWERYWNKPAKYRNDYNFPVVDMSAAELLVKRGCVGIGVDTLSPDKQADGFLIHRFLLGKGKYIVENIANASTLPPVGSFVLVMPIKIAGGVEAPVRLVGLVSKAR